MVPEPRFDHLARLSTPRGMYEHARFTSPRPEHGYCLDDVARALVVTARQPQPSVAVMGLTRGYLDFVLAAQDGRGRFHNRRGTDGGWQDAAGVGDHWGRAVWGLGTAAARSPDDHVRHLALRAIGGALASRSGWTRSMAYAAVGAGQLLEARPGDRSARDLLLDARTRIARPGGDPAWPWPEPRLGYANAVLPEALLVVGAALHDTAALDDGLALLGWLVSRQTRDGHLSVVPAGGWSPGEPEPGFDQQPIEVAALAEACSRALEITGDVAWSRVLDRCVAWFLGANDTGLALYDPDTGGGRDGLHATGVNENQGAESTLAALATLQLGRRAALAAAA